MSRLLSILLVTAALGASACSPAKQTEPVKVPAGSLNIYTARHYDADTLVYDGFTKATGIKVNRLEMKPDQLVERIKAEGEASPADVILMADAGALWRAQQAGLFQPITTPTLEKRIPAALRDPKGMWWGFTRRARVIAYDKATVKPEEVATYEALATPRFKGKVCVRSSDNVYNLSLMAALIEHWGEPKALAWAKGVVANMARPPQGGDIDQIRAVEAGACQVALTNTYYFLRLAASPEAADKAVVSRLALSFPEQAGVGTHTNIAGGGLAAHAPNKAAAIKFLDYMASDEAQAIFAGANHEFPAAVGAPSPPDVVAISQFKADPMAVTIYGERQAQAQSVYDQAGWQ